jgi:hypothetical protein
MVAFDLKTKTSPVRTLKPFAVPNYVEVPDDAAALDAVFREERGGHNTVEDLHAEPFAFFLQSGLEGAAPDPDDDVIEDFIFLRFTYFFIIDDIAVGLGITGRYHEFGFWIAALGADVLVLGIPDPAAHQFHFLKGIPVFTALDLDADAVGKGTVGHVNGPFIGVDVGKGVSRGVAPVVAARAAGAGALDVAFFHEGHLEA